MKELSVFVDESGDFGVYEKHSPFYIITFLFHDQSVDITEDIKRFNQSFLLFPELAKRAAHAGPLIRREYDYSDMNLLDRKQIFNNLYNFARKVDISYHTIIVDKKQLKDPLDLVILITKSLSGFLRDHLKYFTEYDHIIIYYDNGQIQLTKILVSVFNSILLNVDFKKVNPANYRLFQVIDMLCTLELLSLKAERKMLSSSEQKFFKSAKEIEKSYLRTIRKKQL